MSGWRATAADITAITEARHPDPFAILGPHQVSASEQAIRAFIPDADRLLLADDGGPPCPFDRRHPAGFFEILTAGPRRYRLRAENAGGTWEFLDPYAFSPVLGPLDDHLLVEGTHQRLYERLGAHLLEHEGTNGVRFAVWAPNATRVSVVGGFNGWDGRRHPMRKRVDSGIWEIFLPGAGEGAVYKYEIRAANGSVLPLKTDPFGSAAEMRPSTASVVASAALPRIAAGPRHAADPRRAPMAAYEVHLGSWRRGPDGRFLTYDELADTLIPYACDLGFTHLELLPVVLNKVFLLSMTVAGVEVVLQHLRISLVKVPMVVIEAVYRAHHAGAMAASGAVHEELAGLRVVNQLQKRIYLFHAGGTFINYGDVDVAESSSLNGRLLIRPGIVREINHGFDSERGESWVVLLVRPGATIEACVHLSEIADINVREFAVSFLCKRDSG